MKVKILFVSPKGFSPKRHYRGEGVLERLRLLDDEIEIRYPRHDEFWKDAIGCDIVYFMHCLDPMHQQMAMEAMDMGLPVWVDVDDDLFNLPFDNPAAKTIRKREMDVHDFFLMNADMVTTTTLNLSNKIDKRRKKATVIIPNAIDDYAFTDLMVYPEPHSEHVVSWRGGSSHQGDLWDFTEEFWKFLTKDLSAKLRFIGYDPMWIARGMKWAKEPFERKNNIFMFNSQIQTMPYLFNHYEYLHFLRDEGAGWAHVVPLVFNQFNQSKSNIAALEAIYAGSIPVVPMWEEWVLPKAIRYGHVEDLAPKMHEALGMSPEERKKAWEANVHHVKENYVLSKVNKRRLNVIEALMALKNPMYLNPLPEKA